MSRLIRFQAAFLLAGSLLLAGSDARTWKTGMSIRLSPKLTADEFVRWEQAGVDCVEIGPGNVDTPEAQAATRKLSVQVQKWAKSAGIEIWSVHIPFGKNLDISTPSEEQRQDVLRRLDGILKAFAPLKAKKLIVHPSSEPIPPEERQVRIENCRRSLAVLMKRARKMKVQIAIESLPRTCIGNTSREILAILDGIDSLGVCLDTNHVFQEKVDDFVRAVGFRIVTLHVADYDGKDEKHWLPGKGVNDWPAIASALQDVGYSGPFLFECQGTPGEKVAFWKQLRQSLPAPGR